MATGISIKLPISYDPEDGPYALTKTLQETVKQNFKHLMLTCPGERIMDINFGVGIKRFLFENLADDVIEDLRERTFDQVRKYIPFIKITEFKTNYDESNYLWNIRISYVIDPLGVGDELSIDVTEL